MSPPDDGRNHDSLARLLGTSGRANIVEALLEMPAEEFTTEEIAKKAGVDRSTVHRNMDLLLKSNIVEEIGRDGRSQLYRLNINSPVVRSLVQLRKGLLTEVHDVDFDLSQQIGQPDPGGFDSEVTDAEIFSNNQLEEKETEALVDVPPDEVSECLRMYYDFPFSSKNNRQILNYISKNKNNYFLMSEIEEKSDIGDLASISRSISRLEQMGAVIRIPKIYRSDQRVIAKVPYITEWMNNLQRTVPIDFPHNPTALSIINYICYGKTKSNEDIDSKEAVIYAAIRKNAIIKSPKVEFSEFGPTTDETWEQLIGYRIAGKASGSQLDVEDRTSLRHDLVSILYYLVGGAYYRKNESEITTDEIIETTDSRTSVNFNSGSVDFSLEIQPDNLYRE